MRARPVPILVFVTLAGCAAAPPAIHVGPVTAIARADDGALLSASQGGVLLGTPPDLRRIGASGHRPFAVAAIPGGERLLAGGGEPGQRGVLWVQDRHLRFLHAQRVAGDVVTAVAVSGDGRLGAAGCADGTVLLWPLVDPLGARVAVAPHAGACRGVAFAAGGDAVLSCGVDGRLLRTPLPLAPPTEFLGHTAGIECLLLLPDGTVASGARDGRVRVHGSDGRLLRTWQRLGGAVLALAWTGQLCAGTDRGEVLLLLDDREAAVPLVTLPGPVHSLLGGTALWAGLPGELRRVDMAADPRLP